jgi:hypothetical protein
VKSPVCGFCNSVVSVNMEHNDKLATALLERNKLQFSGLRLAMKTGNEKQGCTKYYSDNIYPIVKRKKWKE